VAPLQQAHPVRAVIIGSGIIARQHRRSILACGGEVVGVLSSRPDSTERAASEWHVAGYRGLAEALASGADVVHVCSPNQSHFGYASAALSAGMHVVCEKPLGISAEEAADLADLAAKSGLVATVPFVYRFHPLIREIRARRIAGEFGEWRVMHGSYLQDWLSSATTSNWRVNASTGGPSRAFADIGSHWCDLVEWVSGEVFEEVVASTRAVHARRPSTSSHIFDATESEREETTLVETEDVVAAIFRTERDVLTNLTVSQVSLGRKNRLWFELDGANASVAFDQEFADTIWIGGERESRLVQRDPSQGSAEQRRLSFLPPGHTQGYAECFDAFVADSYSAIRSVRPDGLPTFEDGARSARIVSAVLNSARSGEWVKISKSPSTQALNERHR
jgi:predicted dehydrogenase